MGAAISIFPCAMRSSILPNLAVFTVEEVLLVVEYVRESFDLMRKTREAGDDERALKQVRKLQRRKAPGRKFVRCGPPPALLLSPSH